MSFEFAYVLQERRWQKHRRYPAWGDWSDLLGANDLKLLQELSKGFLQRSPTDVQHRILHATIIEVDE